MHGPFTKEIFQQYLGAPVDWNMPYQMAPDDLNTPKRAGKDNRRKLASNLAEVQETATGKEDGQNDQDEIVLINNGGISTFHLHLTQDVPDEEFAAMIDANLGTMFRATRALVPYLLHAGGRILNVSSVWGVTGASMETVYSLTKGAGARLCRYGHERLDVKGGPGTGRRRDSLRTDGNPERMCGDAASSVPCPALSHRPGHRLRRRLDLTPGTVLSVSFCDTGDGSLCHLL